MPTNTPNFKLIKPTQEEFYDVEVPNNNMDIIDRLLKELQDAITSGATEKELIVLKEALTSHLEDVTNPHGVTKSQVGLSNVQNYGVATIAEAKAGEVNNKYMTPLRVAEAIPSLVPKNVPNGYVGLGPDGLLPSNFTGKKVKIAEVNFAITPAASVDFVIPSGMRRVFIEGNFKIEIITNVYLIYNDITTTSYQVVRLATNPSTVNSSVINVSQTVTESGLYVEIDSSSPKLLTRANSAYNYIIGQMIPGNEVSELQKIKLSTASKFIQGTITVWGEPL